MRLRDQVALTLPTFFLRLILGITFLWAGTGKLMGTYSVTGDDAARLANIGVMPISAAEPAPVITPEEIDESTDEPSGEPIDDTPDLNEQASEIIEMIEEQLDTTEQASESTTNPVSEPVVDPTEDPINDPADEPTIGENEIQLQSVQYSGNHYAATDFPENMEVKQVYSIALMISKAADPGLTDDSNPINPIMPAMFASKPWPKALAWMAAITEITAGIFLIFGFLTRISALGTLSIMLVAMWMTQFGPAAIQSNDAILGFIHRYDDPWAVASYSGLLWQLALAAMSGSVFFMGSGAIGMDRLIFKPTPRDPYVHGDPKAAKLKKNTPPEPGSERSEFDRSPNPTP